MVKMSPIPQAECGCFPSYYLGSPHTHLGTWCLSSLLAFQSLLFSFYFYFSWESSLVSAGLGKKGAGSPSGLHF